MKASQTVSLLSLALCMVVGSCAGELVKQPAKQSERKNPQAESKSAESRPVNRMTAGTIEPCTANGTVFAMIQAGDATMSYPMYLPMTYSGAEDLEKYDVYQAICEVTRPFQAGQTEVTNELAVTVLQWALDNGKLSKNASDHNGVDEKAVRFGSQILFNINPVNEGKIIYSGKTSRFSVVKGYERYPLVSVTFYGAVLLCNWLTEIVDGSDANTVYEGISASWKDSDIRIRNEKKGFRLPTFEEWQFAARYLGTKKPADGDLARECISRGVNGGKDALTAGYYWTPARYASGALKSCADRKETDRVMVHTYQTGWPLKDVSQPVASKSPNQLGCYDMSGNVSEWTSGKMGGSSYVVCGGSWTQADQLSLPLAKFAMYSAKTQGGAEGLRLFRSK